MKRKQDETRHLTRRGSVWYVQARMADGRRIVQSCNTGDLSAAQKVRDQILEPLSLSHERERIAAVQAAITGVDEKIAQIADSQPAMTMLQAWEAFVMAPKGKTPRGRKINPGVRTLTDYEGRWNAFVQWMDKNHPISKDDMGRSPPRELRAVTPELAQRYIAEVKATRSGNTSNKTMTLLRMFFNTLKEQARIKQNPFDGMESDAVSVERKRPLTVEELATVSKMLVGAGEMELLFSLGYYTGGRLGDIMRLRWDNIDMGARKIHYTPHKTAKTKAGRDGVTHGVPPALFALLDKTPKKDRRGLVLKDMGSIYPETPAAVCKQIQKVFTDAGIETGAEVEGYGKKVVRVGFHSLRHSYITALLEKGIPADSVRRMAGHADIAMTMHYFHANESALQAISNALPEIGTTLAARHETATTGTLEAVLMMLAELDKDGLDAVVKRAAKLKREASA